MYFACVSHSSLERKVQLSQRVALVAELDDPTMDSLVEGEDRERLLEMLESHRKAMGETCCLLLRYCSLHIAKAKIHLCGFSPDIFKMLLCRF